MHGKDVTTRKVLKYFFFVPDKLLRFINMNLSKFTKSL